MIARTLAGCLTDKERAVISVNLPAKDLKLDHLGSHVQLDDEHGRSVVGALAEIRHTRPAEQRSLDRTVIRLTVLDATIEHTLKPGDMVRIVE